MPFYGIRADVSTSQDDRTLSMVQQVDKLLEDRKCHVDSAGVDYREGLCMYFLFRQRLRPHFVGGC